MPIILAVMYVFKHYFMTVWFYLSLKLTAVSAFAQTLRRYTSLNHLAQAARAVLQNSSQINQMLADLNRVDFHNVQEQVNNHWERYIKICRWFLTSCHFYSSRHRGFVSVTTRWYNVSRPISRLLSSNKIHLNSGLFGWRMSSLKFSSLTRESQRSSKLLGNFCSSGRFTGTKLRRLISDSIRDSTEKC